MVEKIYWYKMLAPLAAETGEARSLGRMYLF